MEQEITPEQLQSQNQLLIQVNEKLKAEVANLIGRVAELAVVIEALQNQEAAAKEQPTPEAE
jgi:hypothetical protein